MGEHSKQQQRMPEAIIIRRLRQRPAKVLATVVAAGAAWYGATYCFLPEGASTISLLYAEQAFKQCSRDAPIPDGSFWLPTGAQIRAIDATVGQLGREGASAYRYPHTTGYPFLRQYVGFTRKGERLIYVTVTTDDWRYMERLYESGEAYGRHSWRDMLVHYGERLLPEKPHIVCDGGAFNWGMVFNPRTGIFEAPKFNGGGDRVR